MNTRSLRIALLGVLGLLASCSGQEVLNTLTYNQGTDVATNIVYDETTGNRLDIYVPRNARNAPTVVFLYGGRWTQGAKYDYEFVGQALTGRRFVVVVPDYRKYPAVRFPEMMQDAATALRWTHDHIARYGGSPRELFVVGHSTGAHMAALLAMDESWLAGVRLSRANLRGMIGLAGPYDFLPITDPDMREIFAPPDSYARSQPINFADGRNPPLLLVHGEDDQSVWIRNSRSLAQAVAQAGGPVDTLTYEKLSHNCAVAALSQASAVLCGRPDLLAQLADFINTHASQPQ